MAEKVRSGQDIRSSPLYDSRFINELIDTVEFIKMGRYHTPQSPNTHGSNLAVVTLRNSTGGNRRHGEVLQLSDSLIDVEEHISQCWLDADTVDADEGLDRRLAILRGALPDGEIGQAAVAGASQALVNVIDEEHRYAVPVDGEHVLESCASGPFEFLSPAEGTGEQRIWVRVNVAAPPLLCKATDDLSEGPVDDDFVVLSGTMAGGEDSGITELPSIELASDVADGDFFLAHRVNDGWVTSAGGEGGDRIYKAKLDGGLAPGDPVATIDSVTLLSGGAGPTVTEADNFLNKCGANDADCLILKAGSGYLLLDVLHVSETLVKDIEFDDPDEKQTKFTAAVLKSGTDTTSTIWDGEECS